MTKHENIKRAVKNTAAYTVIGMGGAGTGIGWAGCKAYDWLESGEAVKFVDNTGKQASKTVDAVKDKAEKAFSGFGKSLGSVFG